MSRLLSIIIPTLNSSKVLNKCLKSINLQNFNDYEIIIVDGGSNDETLKIAKKFNCKVFNNKLRTGEAGKAVGIKHSKSKYIAFIDSDNILPNNNWIRKLLEPFKKHQEIIGSEPWEYTYRKNGGFIERYSALTGVNDPFTLVSGYFDRRSYLNNKWTKINFKIKNFKNFQIAEFNYLQPLPTVGANGTVFKKEFLNQYFKGDYFFDVDVISNSLNPNHSKVKFAKVKVGIIHTFCESSITKFYRKQLRRVIDLYSFQSKRSFYPKQNFFSIIKFSLYSILIFPMIFDMLRGFLKKPDLAWFFHPLACFITLFCYGTVTIKKWLGIFKPLNRQNWRQ